MYCKPQVFFRMAVIMVLSAEQCVGTPWTRQRGKSMGYVLVRRRKCWVHSLIILIIMEHFGIFFVRSHSQWFLLWRTWVRNIFLVEQVCSFHSSVWSCALYAHVRNVGLIHWLTWLFYIIMFTFFLRSHSQWFLLWRTWVRNIFLVEQVCSFHSSIW